MKSMDHWQRVEAAIAGDAVDRPPVTLWRHFPEDDQHPDKLARHMIEWQRRWDFDLVKFMPSGTYGVEDWGAVSAYGGQPNGARSVVQPAVTRTDDWLALVDLDVRAGSYRRQNEALALTAQALQGSVPILQTVFSPLTTARKLSTERLFADLRRHPDVLERALRVITDVTVRFAQDALDAGAHGMFFASQLSTHRLLTDAEYERFGKAYDLQVFAAVAGKTRCNMLHVHGDDIMFDLLASYPADMLNWHDRRAEPNLRAGVAGFRRAVVGGLDEHGTLLAPDLEAVRHEVRDAIEQTNGRRLLLGPGCVVPIGVRDDAIAAVLQVVRQTAARALA
jgi:uroporphyrinogen decarboxylase